MDQRRTGGSSELMKGGQGEGCMKTQMMSGLLVCGLLLALAGCSGYYRVTDPGSGKTYYTTFLDERAAGVKFKDDKTGNAVILHSLEVAEIPKEEYEAEVNGTSKVVSLPPVAAGPARTEQ